MPGVVSRVCFFEAPGASPQIGFALFFDPPFPTEPADDVEDVHGTPGHPGTRIDCQRRPQLDLTIGEKESRRHDSHYIERSIVDANRFAKQTGIAAKTTLQI